MSAVVPDTLEVKVLHDIIVNGLSLRLFGNNKVPAHGDTLASYNEVAGGGYTSKTLAFANFTVTAGDPSKAVYNTAQEWLFTAILTAPGTVYGYYLVRVSDSQVILAERFPSGSLPFIPIAGSKIVILPKVTAQSEF